MTVHSGGDMSVTTVCSGGDMSEMTVCSGGDMSGADGTQQPVRQADALPALHRPP